MYPLAWHPILRSSFCAIGLVGVATISATSVAAQSISNATSLSFGSFVAGTGGTVTVSPASIRSATGGVTLISSGAGAASQATISGTLGSTYSITLPANNSVSLSDGNAHTMAVNQFASNPAATSGSTGLLLVGSQNLLIGATLSVTNNQVVGNYSGTFSVTVTYP